MTNTLWDCENAVVGGHLKTYVDDAHAIVCRERYPLPTSMNTMAIKHGVALKPTICQDCPEYIPNEGVPKGERGGW